MKSRRILHGLMGLLSLLGFTGIFTEVNLFWRFLHLWLILNIFLKSDEYMNKSASRAFYFGMITAALVSLICCFAGLKEEHEAFITALAPGWFALLPMVTGK